MSFIEIEGIAELLNCTKQAAWTIVGDKEVWKVPHCGYRKSGANRKRQWDEVMATKEVERINKLRVEPHWKANIVNRSWVLMNTSVRQFPINGEIREYLIEEKGIAAYKAFT